MLELLIATLVQLNSVFGDIPVTYTPETGGNGWGDTHVNDTVTAPRFGGQQWTKTR